MLWLVVVDAVIQICGMMMIRVEWHLDLLMKDPWNDVEPWTTCGRKLMSHDENCAKMMTTTTNDDGVVVVVLVVAIATTTMMMVEPWMLVVVAL